MAQQYMKVFNQGARNIFGFDDGRNYQIAPKSTVKLTQEEGEKLRRLYPNEILNIDDVRNQHDAALTNGESAVRFEFGAAPQPLKPVTIAGMTEEEKLKAEAEAENFKRMMQSNEAGALEPPAQIAADNGEKTGSDAPAQIAADNGEKTGSDAPAETANAAQEKPAARSPGRPPKQKVEDDLI